MLERKSCFVWLHEQKYSVRCFVPIIHLVYQMQDTQKNLKLVPEKSEKYNKNIEIHRLYKNKSPIQIQEWFPMYHFRFIDILPKTTSKASENKHIQLFQIYGMYMAPLFWSSGQLIKKSIPQITLCTLQKRIPPLKPIKAFLPCWNILCALVCFCCENMAEESTTDPMHMWFLWNCGILHYAKSGSGSKYKH